MGQLKIRRKVLPIGASRCISIPDAMIKFMEAENEKTLVSFDVEYNEDGTLLLTPIFSDEYVFEGYKYRRVKK